MTLRKKKLVLHATLREATGCGDGMEFEIEGSRTTKAGNHEHYDLRLKVCRYGVRRILEELAKMHGRDRERIQRELSRIDREIAMLKAGGAS